MIRVSSLQAGEILIADKGFVCLPPGEYVVKDDSCGLHIECPEHIHYLEPRIFGNDVSPKIGGLTRKS